MIIWFQKICKKTLKIHCIGSHLNLHNIQERYAKNIETH